MNATDNLVCCIPNILLCSTCALLGHIKMIVMKWKHFPHYWPFVRGIHRSPVNSAHKGQWRGGLMFSLICAWINDWVNNREAGELRRYRAHYDVIVMIMAIHYNLHWNVSRPLVWETEIDIKKQRYGSLKIYRKISNISRTKSKNLNASRLIL